jgi:hypothetical protein
LKSVVEQLLYKVINIAQSPLLGRFGLRILCQMAEVLTVATRNVTAMKKIPNA